MKRDPARANRQYLMRRLAQEEAAEKAASNPKARQSHREMAKRYREECESDPTGSDTALVSR